MDQFIKNTGLNFVSGQALKTTDLVTINDTINQLVNAVNNLMKGIYNVNIETNNFEPLSLQDALRRTLRRSLGMKVRFLGVEGKYIEYSYIGRDIDDSSWYDTSNWVGGLIEIDGGAW